MENPISHSYTDKHGITYTLEYFSTDSFENLPQNAIRQCYGFAFHNNKLVLVNNVNHPGQYTPVGGSVEEGENPDETLIREIQEESNMKVLHYKPIGYQKVNDSRGSEPYYQLRYFCIVEPYGLFVKDPAGDVSEVLEIDPKDYKTYFDWGEVGESVMKQALVYLSEYKNK